MDMREIVKKLKTRYPAGTRVELVKFEVAFVRLIFMHGGENNTKAEKIQADQIQGKNIGI